MGRARRLVESSSGVIGAGRAEIKRFMLRKGTYSCIPVRGGGNVAKGIKVRRVNRSRDGEKSSGAIQDVRRVLGMGGIGTGGLKRLGSKYSGRVGEVIGRRRVSRAGVESGEGASAKKEVKEKQSAMKVEKRSASVIAVRSKRMMRGGAATVNPPLENPRLRPVERYDGIIMLRRRDGMDGKQPVESKPEGVMESSVEAEVAAGVEAEKPGESAKKVEESVVASHPVAEVEESEGVETAAVFPELGFVEEKVSEEAKGKKKGRQRAKKGRKKSSSAEIVSTEVGESVVQAVQAALNDASDAASLAREAAESAAKVNGEDRKA